MKKTGASQAKVKVSATPVPAATSDLYSDALAALTSLRKTMLSAEWQAQLDKASPADRLDSSRKLIQVQQAILNLTNQSLSDIASEMKVNGEELAKSTENLTNALKSIENVEAIIEAAGTVISTVAKLVPMI